MTGKELPYRKTAIPGPRSRELAGQLRQWESPGVTTLSDRFPVFWERALGSNVEDVDGNLYIDGTGAFAVANCGHTHPGIATRVAAQAQTLLHGMGDVHPPRIKVELLGKLAAIAPGDLCQTILSSSGSEAIESALKTALIHTRRPMLIAFHGAYHGLSHGTLATTARRLFRTPFWGQIAPHVVHVPFPDPYRPPLGASAASCAEACLDYLAYLLDHPATGIGPVGAVLVEPIQGRGGMVIPPSSFLPGLKELCARHNLLLIADEIYTGFGRTGRWFAVEHAGVVPDLLCLGKGLAGGMPISACIGTPEVMKSWGLAQGEALHTSTFLGHPPGCAAALGAIAVIQEEQLVERSATLGRWLLKQLHHLSEHHTLIGEVRGMGLLAGIELVTDRTAKTPATRIAWHVVEELLQKGVVLLTAGSYANVLALTPPLTITREQLDFCLEAIDTVLTEIEQGSG